MSEHERVDLSALDPMTDPAHWRSVMDATLARVDAVLDARGRDPLSMIAGWTRPLLVAAAAAIALLVPVELALETREWRAEQVRRLVALSSEWGRDETPPSGADFLRALAAEEQP